MSLICLLLNEKTIKENVKLAQKNYSKIDVVELRTDLLTPDQYEKVNTFTEKIELPAILTCRIKSDGGKWDGSESDRRNHLLNWLNGSFDFVDLEYNIDDEKELLSKAKSMNTKIIRSFHDFEGVPNNLEEIMCRYESNKNIIVKGAVYPKSSKEFYRFLQVSQKLKSSKSFNQYSLLAMGDIGFPSRVLSESLGSLMTYCSNENSVSRVPGHCTVGELHDLYGFKSINKETVVNGIIGNPLKQSLSPQLHNSWYKKNGQNALYLPFLCDSLQWFIKIADLLQLNGVSITIPFKSDILSLVKNHDSSVVEVDAANTMYRSQKGKWQLANTDIYGFIKPLLELLKGKNLKGVKISVIGAGGAAKAVLSALKEQGADIAIFNRTIEHAKELALRFNCKYFQLDQSTVHIVREYSTIICQTTNVGMFPLEGLDPLSFYDFHGDEIVYDLIYKPEETPLLKRAKSANCRILNGKNMLIEQALKQHDLFMSHVESIEEI